MLEKLGQQFARSRQQQQNAFRICFFDSNGSRMLLAFVVGTFGHFRGLGAADGPC